MQSADRRGERDHACGCGVRVVRQQVVLQAWPCTKVGLDHRAGVIIDMDHTRGHTTFLGRAQTGCFSSKVRRTSVALAVHAAGLDHDRRTDAGELTIENQAADRSPLVTDGLFGDQSARPSRESGQHSHHVLTTSRGEWVDGHHLRLATLGVEVGDQGADLVA
ncbi:hypothetical protein GCM10009872_47540 [Actinopolymorpha rutila]